MLGAVAGDIVGSDYEGRKAKTKDFPLFSGTSVFTDDTVLTCAVAYSIMKNVSYKEAVKSFAKKYINAGYGGRFFHWVMSDEDKPYNSFGNGSAMRVSPIGFAYDSVNEVLNQAKKSAEITHNHPEGIKGAQAAALCVYLAGKGASKKEIKTQVQDRFEYNLNFNFKGLVENYGFDVTCQGSVPQAIFAFLISTDYIDALRNCVAIGGDSDTTACIAGAIAQAYYKEIPICVINKCKEKLDDYLWKIVKDFSKKYLKVKFK